MNRLRYYVRRWWELIGPPTIVVLFAFAVIIIGSVANTGCERPTATSAAATLTTVQTDYQSVELTKRSDQTDFALTIRNIVGVKVEPSNISRPDGAPNAWLFDGRISAIVAVRERLAGSELGEQAVPSIRLIKLIGSPKSFSTVLDAKSDQASWLSGTAICGKRDFACNEGAYVIGNVTIHLHSLDELH